MPSAISSRAGRYARWSPDGRSIFFIDANAQAVWSGSNESGTEHQAATLDGKPGTIGIYGLAVGREHVYFLWSEDIGDIWVMDVVRGE